MGRRQRQSDGRRHPQCQPQRRRRRHSQAWQSRRTTAVAADVTHHPPSALGQKRRWQSGQSRQATVLALAGVRLGRWQATGPFVAAPRWAVDARGCILAAAQRLEGTRRWAKRWKENRQHSLTNAVVETCHWPVAALPAVVLTVAALPVGTCHWARGLGGTRRWPTGLVVVVRPPTELVVRPRGPMG